MMSVAGYKMGDPVGIKMAKTYLSRLIARAEAGEEVVIARQRKPVVKMVALTARPKRVPGRWKGKISIGPEFYEPMSEEELALWHK
jgi:antitoxin (DNA-binding transcriptional repressor) of toxin-antitoxin stability system